MRSLEELNVAKKFLNVDLTCFEFNADLYQNLTLFVEKLYEFYGEISISVDFDMSSFTEACLCVTLYNLPVFFKVNQNSLVRIATAPVDSSQNADVDDFWLKVDGCYMQKTFVGDEQLPALLKKIKVFMYKNFIHESRSHYDYQSKQVELQTKEVSRKITNLIWQAPLSGVIYTLLQMGELELDLTNVDFLITLILNTGLAMGFLVGIEALIDKFKDEIYKHR